MAALVFEGTAAISSKVIGKHAEGGGRARASSTLHHLATWSGRGKSVMTAQLAEVVMPTEMALR